MCGNIEYLLSVSEDDLWRDGEIVWIATLLSRKRASGVIQVCSAGRGILPQQSELLPDEAGMIGETTVNPMFIYDRILLPADNTAVKHIDTLDIRRQRASQTASQRQRPETIGKHMNICWKRCLGFKTKKGAAYE